uniref:Uncharacterized protein n=1 Tax=Anguilla anguilla TaxID=7936 RepID=A0A0E9T969_ANGAN
MTPDSILSRSRFKSIGLRFPESP